MAEALLVHELAKLGIEADVQSAGLRLDCDKPPLEHAVACMQRRGLDITDHRSRHIDSVRNREGITHAYVVEQCFISGLQDHDIPLHKIHLLNKEQGGVPGYSNRRPESIEQCACVLETEARKIAEELAVLTGAKKKTPIAA